jgi:hypothetical protein
MDALVAIVGAIADALFDLAGDYFSQRAKRRSTRQPAS